MDKLVTEIAKNIILDKGFWDAISKKFGVIVNTQPVTMNGEKGFLVWDYIIYNEITFVNSITKDYTSMFTSISDKKTKAKFEELVSKYGS